MSTDSFRGTNRDKASFEQIFGLCKLLWTDEKLHPAFVRVGVLGYFEMDEYLRVHETVTRYWQELGGDIYLGDLFLSEAIVRNVAADVYPEIDCEASRNFIQRRRPLRHEDGSLMHGVPASVDEVLELIEDLRGMIRVKELCDQAQQAYEAGDREKIEKIIAKENYLAERYRRKKGYMEKMGYSEAFTVLRDLLSGEYKQDINSERLRARVEQGLQFWNY